MTTLNGYIQGLGGGADRIVRKTGKEVKLSVFDNIDDVIVFNQTGETTQKTLTGKNKSNFNNGQAYSGSLTSNYFEATLNRNTLNRVELQEGVTYTFSADVTSDIEPFYMTVGAGNGGYSKDIKAELNLSSGRVSCTFTPTADNLSLGNVFCFRLPRYATSQTFDFTVDKVQIETGSTATPYEPYCDGIPSPNPDYPQDIKGIGVKQLDGTYKVSIDYWDERDERDGRITASGLAYPLYEGDILDFANGKVIRANGYRVFDGSENWITAGYAPITYYGLSISDMNNGNLMVGYCNRLIGTQTAYATEVKNSIRFGWSSKYIYISVSDDFTLADWKTYISNNETYIVYPLASPVEEYITIEGGDISDIGTARVEADGTLTVKYDKVEMAIRKYSSPPDWSKIGYTETPSFVLDAFDYSKQIYDSWTPAASYASKYRGDKALKFFPEVDLTGATNYSAMFQESGILSTPPLTIGDGSNTVINSQWMFQTTPIEKIELTTSEATQKVQIANIFNGCTMLKNAKLTLSASGSMQYAFADCTRLERIEDGLETSDVTSFSEAFRACSSLLYLYELDLSSCTTCYRAFQNCTSLYSAPYLNNILTGGNFQQMFWNCSSLRILPPYNLKSPTNLTNMFQGTGSNLDESSRINILFMLAGCTYSGTKTLAHLGFTASMYSAASWQALPTYNDFISAGWSIGYN